MRSVYLSASLATLCLAGKVYNSTKAFEALYYSAAAYCDVRDVAAWNCGVACQSNSGFVEVENF